MGDQDSKQIVTKGDLPAFTELTIEEQSLVSDPREAHLTILALDFFDRNREWKFSDGNAEFSATITDPEFWRRVDCREYKVGKGDRLHVSIVVTQKLGVKPVTKYEIVDVYEVIEPPTQEELGL